MFNHSVDIVHLSRDTYAATHAYSPEVLKAVEMQSRFETITDHELRRTMLTKILVHHDTVALPPMPVSGWEAIRERWAPAWWLRRYPVRYHTPMVEVRAKYPTLVIQGDPHRAYVELRYMDTTSPSR